MKSQWCTRRFSSSGLFRLLNLVLIDGGWILWAGFRIGGCGYGGGGVRLGGPAPMGEPGSEIGGVSGEIYISLVIEPYSGDVALPLA